MQKASVYAEPREITDIEDCYFYHSLDIPGHGPVEGEWDLRPNVDRYLGGVDFRGKRVLDVGTASGFLTFHMERRGADVVSFDLSEEEDWDIVPFARSDVHEKASVRREHIRRLNNGYWFCRSAFGSQSQMAYGTVYSIPQEIGPVDVSVFGSILLHLRDPFRALESALRLTRDTVVVTDAFPRRYAHLRYLDGWYRPWMRLLPNFRRGAPYDGWWFLTPAIVREFVGILGFEETKTTFHSQLFRGRRRPMYTVVGRRTAPVAPEAGEAQRRPL